MFTGACKKQEMDWQLFASYFTVKSTDIFAVLSDAYTYHVCFIGYYCFSQKTLVFAPSVWISAADNYNRIAFVCLLGKFLSLWGG